jgi:hypothetical protein
MVVWRAIRRKGGSLGAKIYLTLYKKFSLPKRIYIYIYIYEYKFYETLVRLLYANGPIDIEKEKS